MDVLRYRHGGCSQNYQVKLNRLKQIVKNIEDSHLQGIALQQDFRHRRYTRVIFPELVAKHSSSRCSDHVCAIKSLMEDYCVDMARDTIPSTTDYSKLPSAVFEEVIGLVQNPRNKSSWDHAIDTQRALRLDDNDPTVVNAKSKLSGPVPRSVKSKP